MRAEGGAAAEASYYEMGADLQLKPVDDAKALDFLKKSAPIPAGVISVDAASVLYVSTTPAGAGACRRATPAFDQPGPLGDERVDREVCTERDLFNAHGTFYELPADNAGGFAKIRPIATHNRRIHDYCSLSRPAGHERHRRRRARGAHIIRATTASARSGRARWMTSGRSANRAAPAARGTTPPSKPASLPTPTS